MPSLDLGPVVGPQGEQGATGAQGIRGEQGLPGPNQVTNSTATPLTGVLTGNGSVVGVTSVDAAPTDDSTNLVSSGGTKVALDTKANQAQLAYVENGTTASQNYTAGQYISWNGLLYTANQAISSGTTLSAGTGGNLTECVGGGLNSLINDDVGLSRVITPLRADVFSASRSGKMVQVCINNLSYDQNFATDTVIATISPKPVQYTRFILYTRSNTVLSGFIQEANGAMYLNGYTSGDLLYGSFCYLTK